MNNNIQFDPYNILNIDKNATKNEIKTSFKKLALLYHPDKNINNNINKENNNINYSNIRFAYELLIDEEKRKQYDNMNKDNKNIFINNLFTIIKKLNNNNIINIIKKNIINDFKDGNINDIINYIINEKFLDNIKLDDIFIPYSDNNSQDNNSSYICISNNNNNNNNSLDIIGEIKTTLDDIYNNKLKEIIIKKKIIDKDKISYEDKKYYIPLYNPQIIINNGGIKDNVNNMVGNTIINILQKKHKLFNRKDYNIIYIDKISLFELFNGFNKKLIYFNNELINLVSSEPLKEYDFNGSYLEIVIKNKGLPIDIDNNRGDLIIYLYINKSNDFHKYLKNYFN